MNNLLNIETEFFTLLNFTKNIILYDNLWIYSVNMLGLDFLLYLPLLPLLPGPEVGR